MAIAKGYATSSRWQMIWYSISNGLTTTAREELAMVGVRHPRKVERSVHLKWVQIDARVETANVERFSS